MNEFVFLLPALVACFILTGIHTYLGIHVISRGIIFLDIALAQVAALGLTLGLLLGFEAESQSAYVFALGLTFLMAVFFSFVRTRKVPMEAIIGVTFVVSSAVSILLVDRMPHGVEHLKYILSGNVLWVTWPQIIKTAVIYLLIGIVLFWYHKRLMLVSTAYELAKKQGVKVKIWDLFFYVMFGVVITSSVQIAGILLVFSFLIMPALCSMLFFTNMRARIIFGWVIGLVSSVVGLGFSYYLDLPTGPCLVAVMGGAVAASFLWQKIKG